MKSEESEIVDRVRKIYGDAGSNPADYLYVFEDESPTQSENIDKEPGEGSLMELLAYNKREMDFVGDDDIPNFTGVGNPHRRAMI